LVSPTTRERREELVEVSLERLTCGFCASYVRLSSLTARLEGTQSLQMP